MQSQQSSPGGAGAEAQLTPGRRAKALLGLLADQIARLVQAALVGLGLIVLVMLSSDLAGTGGVRYLIFMVLWLVLWLGGIAIHELGHYAAARWMGMRVVSMSIWRFECAPQRRGMRVRWRGGARPGRHGGHVIAFADPSRSIRAAHLVMAAGGPAANLAAAGLFGTIGVLSTGLVTTLCLMVAATHLMFGLVNLVPHGGRFASDGYLLVRFLRGGPDLLQHPHIRLVRLSLFGTTADRLPEGDLVALEGEPFPAPLVALWYRLKACQNLGEWGAAAAMRDGFERLVDGRSKAERAFVRHLVDCLRAELAFSTAMHTRASDGLTDGLLPAASAWHEPHLWPRCQALKAAIEGDWTECGRQLERAQSLAGNSIDASLPLSEGMIRASMASAFPAMHHAA